MDSVIEINPGKDDRQKAEGYASWRRRFGHDRDDVATEIDVLADVIALARAEGRREGLEKAAMYNEGFRAGLEEAATVLDDLGPHRTDSDGHALVRADQIQARIRRLKG